MLTGFRDLERRRPSGRTDLADRYVLLTLPYGWDGTSALPALAGWYGLDCYDPQAEQLVTSELRLRASDGGGPAEVSACINYRYDYLDEAALAGAFDQTSDAWFEYPLQGTPPLTVRLARSPDRTVVSVRVEGTMDLVLATRIESLLNVCS